MREREERTIDGIVVAVQQPGATAGFKLLADLMAALGAPLLELAAAAGAGKPGGSIKLADLDLDIGRVALAIEALFRANDGEKLMALAMRLLAHARLDGKEATKDVVDVVLRGRIFTLFKVLAFVVEVLFHDFFGAMKGRAGAGPAATDGPSP